jgi:hypothetical protein
MGRCRRYGEGGKARDSAKMNFTYSQRDTINFCSCVTRPSANVVFQGVHFEAMIVWSTFTARRISRVRVR